MSNILNKITETLAQREANYDHPKPNFERIAAYWNVYLGDRLSSPITATDVAMLMVLMKTAREQYKHTDDNLIDMVGYVLCAERIIEKEAEEQAETETLEFTFGKPTKITLDGVEIGDFVPPQQLYDELIKEAHRRGEL